MMNDQPPFEAPEIYQHERQGNAWSGVVALALLAMFALALVASEIDSMTPNGANAPTTTVIAGQ